MKSNYTQQQKYAEKRKLLKHLTKEFLFDIVYK